MSIIADRLSPVFDRINTQGMARDSLIMIIAGFISSLFVYLYQFFMGVLLPTAAYGTLLSLTSLLVIFSVLTQTVTFVTARPTANLHTAGRILAINYLWQSSVRRTFIIGLFTFALVAAFSPLIGRFLHLDSLLPIILTFSTLVFAFTLSANWGVMQGLQRFYPLGISQVLWGFLRFAFGALLVYLGLGWAGGLAAWPLSYLITLGLTFLLLRSLSQYDQEKVPYIAINSYAWFTLLALLAITMLTNFDVVLAKHYLSADDVGSYSIISVLGRIAFYAPAGITVALFPKTASSSENNGNHRQLFFPAFWLTLAMVVVICLGYALFSFNIIHLHLPEKYMPTLPYLFKYGVGMSCLAISYLVMTYFLSFGKTVVAYPLLAAMLLQVILIGFFHANIAEIVNIMMISGAASLALIIPVYRSMK